MSLLPLLLASLLASSDESAVRVAVMPLAARSVRASTVETITDILAGQLISQGGARVMERSEMNRILREQGFQKSGACDGRKCAVEVGRILGIDQMIVGAFGMLGDSWVLTARRVSVETGEIVAQSTRQYEGPLAKVPDLLVAPVVADLAGVGWDAPEVAEAIVPPQEARPQAGRAPPRADSLAPAQLPEADVPIRIRHQSDSTQSWLYIENGSTRRFLGKTPLDTVVRLRQNVFVVATEPKEGGATRYNWLIGPTDSAQREWRIAGRGRMESWLGSSASKGGQGSELGRWSTYRKAVVDSSRGKVGRGIRNAGGYVAVVGGCMMLGGLMAITDSSLALDARRETAKGLLGLGAATVGVGAVVALVGQTILEASGAADGATALSVRPVERIGASGTASGIAIAARF